MGVSAHTASSSSSVLGTSHTSGAYSLLNSASVSTTLTAWSGAPNVVSVLASGGLSAGSFIATSGSVAAISNAGTAQINPLYPTVPGFVYIGTGSSTGTNAALPSYFIGGIMSTGAVPTSVALTTTALTFTGTAANAQPWVAMIGS